MNYKQFEDLPIWQKSRYFVKKIFELIESTPRLKNNYNLRDQLSRATTSIALNIAEGFERHSNKEFANFLNIAKGSAGEVRCILYLLHDIDIINNENFDIFYREISEISAQLSNLRKFLLNNQK